jgi:DNA adenine methylase
MHAMRAYSRLGLARPVAPRRLTLPPRERGGPIVKWAGGKRGLLGELGRRAPRTYLRYFEPFVGGGALFFDLQPAAAFLGDRNAELIDTYRAVRDEVDGVISALAGHRARHDEDHYYATREAWNHHDVGAGAERAAAFIYLNKTCYNGLWRVNSHGQFNVPVGRYVNPPILDPENLRAASRTLAAAHLDAGDFEGVLEDARAGDFVYFDPPYDPVSETADFTSYTPGRFGKAEQERLAGVFRELHGRGCAVMLSNSDTPFVHRLYAGFKVERVSCNRAINSRADARGAVWEVIVTNSY